jgi:signal transduction histidine kinase
MAVFRADGARLAGTLVQRKPFDEAAAVAGLPAAGRGGSALLPDGSERLVSVRRLRTLDLVLVLTRDRQAVLGRWREVERLAVLALAALWVTLGAALWAVRRADRRRAQAQHALAAQRDRASRLESLGTLAGGVAHDFNNVLAGIVGFGEMAMDAAPPQSAQARHLDRLMQVAMRGKALVERILVFSRGGTRAASVFALLPVVEEALSMTAATLPPGVVVERDLAAPEARLRGDPTQVFEVLTNLCGNAVQAMPDGGRLSVGLRRCRVGAARQLSHAELAAGTYLELRVCDTGCGIAPGAMDRLFEPFFTTRGASSGTGLGLAVVYGCVAEMGGAIDVQSEPGRGASFTLYLPEFHEPASRRPPAGQRAP